MKGIILAGGKGTRLYPSTQVLSKQILPIYDKPMIYYPLSTLMLGGIREILIITTLETELLFKNLLGDGSRLGLKLTYAIQTEPRGLADAFIVGEEFIGESSCALILGDNLFFGDALSKRMEDAAKLKAGAYTFASYVSDPEQYGVCYFDENDKPSHIIEKPEKPSSNWAITGLYFYDHKVVDYARRLQPSKRNELEITDLNMLYLERQELTVEKLGRGFAWFDTGTPGSLLNASEFVRTIETRQRYKIACLEEIALRKKYIDQQQYQDHIAFYQGSEYGWYLKNILLEMKD